MNFGNIDLELRYGLVEPNHACNLAERMYENIMENWVL